MVVPKSNIANIQSDSVMYNAQNNFPFNPSLPSHSTRLDNIIQQGHPISRASIGGPWSPSPSPTYFSTSLDIDYAKRVAIQNNMDINKLAINNLQSQEPTLALIQPHAPSKVVSINMLEQDSLSQLLSSDIIPYSANILANPSLWDGIRPEIDLDLKSNKFCCFIPQN